MAALRDRGIRRRRRSLGGAPPRHKISMSACMAAFALATTRVGASCSSPSSSLRVSSRALIGSFVAPAANNSGDGRTNLRGSAIAAVRPRSSVAAASARHSDASSSRSSSSSSSGSGRGFGALEEDGRSRTRTVDVPLVFVPGMKGTHLAFDDDDAVNIGRSSTERRRAWLTLGNLLNFPPRPDGDPDRDLSLPLSYERDDPSRQRRGRLVPDGIVDHIIEWNVGGEKTPAESLNLLPFYGHATRMLRDMDRDYHSLRRDGKDESTRSFRTQDGDAAADAAAGDVGGGGILERVGSFAERTASSWGFSNSTDASAVDDRRSRLSSVHRRPTAAFAYDWRRPLPELSLALHEFCEETFPGTPVQIVAHSMGGLMCFDAMRRHPEKYAPGAVVTGVPFETGIQYLQDLHKGYFTELDRCRQFTPEKQFTMSSHWGFFPITKDRLEDRFVDVSEKCEAGQEIEFEADKSGIGKKVDIQPKVDGDNAYFDFYDADEWERLNIGVFGPEYDDLLTDEQRRDYKEHMTIQMKAAKEWRRKILGERTDDEEGRGEAESFLPPFVACATDAVPTVNQILRRERKASSSPGPPTRKGRSPENPYEYDYVSGRSVPGDGRIDFDKAFPPGFVSHKKVTLDSAHAKQMCWEESGGSWGTIYEEVVEQAEEYLRREREKEKEIAAREREKEKETAADVSSEEIPDHGRGRGGTVMRRMAFQARNARKRRLRRKRLVKIVAARPKRFAFRRRKS